MEPGLWVQSRVYVYFVGAWIDSLFSWALLRYLVSQESSLHCLGINNPLSLLGTKFCWKLVFYICPRTASISRFLFFLSSHGSLVLQTAADANLAPCRPEVRLPQETVYWEPSAQVAFALASGGSFTLVWCHFTSWIVELPPGPSTVSCFSLACSWSTRLKGCSDGCLIHVQLGIVNLFSIFLCIFVCKLGILYVSW